MKRFQRWIIGGGVLMLAAIVALSLPIASAQTEAPSIHPVVTLIAAGNTIEFAGVGFVSGERISAWATAPDQTVYGSNDFATARSDGSVSLSFDVPGDALGGTWAFTAYGDVGVTPAITSFEVQANESSENRNTDTVTPTIGVPGTWFQFEIYGFKKQEKVSYWITGPDGQVYAAYPDGTESSRKGKVSIVWNAPTSAPTGTWVITAQGLQSSRAKGLAFQIQ